MDDSGAKRLIAAILKQAYDDYTKVKSCPEWCGLIDTCEQKKIDGNHCEAKQFIHTAWCASLCDSIGVDHEKYVSVTIKHLPLTKETYKYIESELRMYKQTCRELEQMKRDIILETPVKQEGHGYDTSDPTAQKTAKILRDRRIKRYEEIVNAIKCVYEKCDDQKKKLIEMRYWQNRYTDEGISYHLGVDRKTIYHWKKAIIYAVALELGYL